MTKKKRILIIITVTLLILCITFAVIGILHTPNDTKKPIKEEIPKITEDFKSTELNSVLTTTGKFYLDEETNDILEVTSDKTYIIGNNGKLYNNKIEQKDTSEDNNVIVAKSKNIEFYIGDNDYCYFINTKTKKKSKDYDDIILPYQKDITGIYAILKTYNEKTNTVKYELLNTNNGNITELNTHSSIIENDSSITYRGMDEQNYTDSLNYFHITNETNKVGLIDYKGNIVIDIVYDSIEVFNDKYVIVSKDNKYGIITINNEEIIPFIYDNIYTVDNYIILTKDNKISIASSNAKIYIKDKIDTSSKTTSNENAFEFTSTTINNKLYLQVYNKSKTSIYLINNKDIERKISTSSSFELLETQNGNYIYTFEKSVNKVNLTFYDLDLYEYFKTIFDSPQIDSYYRISPLQHNKNYFEINMYTKIDNQDKTYYIDLFNSKQIDEYTALKRYFPNGYNLFISSDKLTIYKETEQLEEFEGAFEFLGEYLLIKNQNEIVEVQFKNDN